MNYKTEVKIMILKCNNEKVVNLVKYFETLDFADKLRLSIDMLESYHIKVKNDEDVYKRQALWEDLNTKTKEKRQKSRYRCQRYGRL